MAYQQFTLEERTIIYAFCKAEYSITAIAEELSRHKSTISREIKRHTGWRGYRPKHANEKTVQENN